MNVLGLSFGFHDATSAVSDGARLLFAGAEERFSLQKHDAAFPELSIRAGLGSAGLVAGALDMVAYYERPAVKFTRVLGDSLARFPSGATHFTRAMKRWLGSELWQRNVIASRLGIAPRRVVYLPHHECHAAQAFCASGFEAAAILVVDGVGELSSTTLATASCGEARPRILEEHEFPRSIGLVYSAFTAYLGFKPNSGESSTMALAAYGQPRYAEEMQQLLRSNADGTYEVDSSYFNFFDGPESLFTDRMVQRFGPPRKIGLSYSFDSLRDSQEAVPADDQRCADIAASLQFTLEEVLMGLCRRLRRLSGLEKLCLSGGVALNCLANSRIVKEAGFTEVFIPPDPGDGGAAIGAAALAAGSLRSDFMDGPYVGARSSLEDVRALLDQDFLLTHSGQMRTLPGKQPARIEIDAAADDDRLLDRVADDLCGGRIVGWVQGRFECGPRALGNRSLLVDPSNLAAVRRLSHHVKSHSLFRPYAISMTADAATRLLKLPAGARSVARWMQSVWPVEESLRDRVRGGVHFDGTTRPQVCHLEDNPRYHGLLERFGAAKGSLPALLNTSYNERSMPMTSSAAMAMSTWLRNDIDTLVIDKVLLRKCY
jgi:carbamoyltransferase